MKTFFPDALHFFDLFKGKRGPPRYLIHSPMGAHEDLISFYWLGMFLMEEFLIKLGYYEILGYKLEMWQEKW